MDANSTPNSNLNLFLFITFFLSEREKKKDSYFALINKSALQLQKTEHYGLMKANVMPHPMKIQSMFSLCLLDKLAS